MDNFWHALSGHSVFVAMVVVIFLFAVYFLFKQFVKFVLLLILIFLLIGGYFYFKGHAGSPRNVGQVLKDAGTQVNKAVEKGKNLYRKGKEVKEDITDVFGDKKETPTKK
jgi:hypothetical protein